MSSLSCVKCNKDMAAVQRWFKCTGCSSHYCPSCKDNFCMLCRKPVRSVEKAC